MPISTEVLFILGIVGFYLYDLAVLSFFNEFFMIQGFNTKKIKVYFASDGLNFSKKYLIFSHLLSYKLVFHSKWSVNQPIKCSTYQRIELIKLLYILKNLRVVQYLNLVSFIMMLIVLPLTLILKINYSIIAVVLIVIYLLNFSVLTYLCLKRKVLHLSSKQLFHFAIDVFLCPPQALNIVKKITLNYEIQTNDFELVRYFLKEGFNPFIDSLVKNIDILKDTSSYDERLLIRYQKALEKIKAP